MRSATDQLPAIRTTADAIEWDNNIPPLEMLLAQARHADTVIERESEAGRAVAA